MLHAASVDAVARAFGLGPVVECVGPVARGEVGEVHRLRTTTGRWAVKRPFGAVDEPTAERTTLFAEAARAAGVATPAARWTTDGRILLPTIDGPLRVHAWVDLPAEPERLDPVGVGRLVAQLHRTPDAGGGAPDDWYSAPVTSRRWSELQRRLTAAGAPFAADLQALSPGIAALEALVPGPGPVRTCHRDLFADNLRTDSDGTVWVLDFDAAGPMDPAHELAQVLYDVGAGDPVRVRTLYDAYRAADGPALVTGPGDFATVAAVLGHINERACVRWLAASPDDPERNRMAALVGEFVERPLTLATIDDILAALGRP